VGQHAQAKNDMKLEQQSRRHIQIDRQCLSHAKALPPGSLVQRLQLIRELIPSVYVHAAVFCLIIFYNRLV
jgi:hypothetical protein